MEASKGRRQRVKGRLWKVLEAARSARDAEDRVITDRDGELLPDPTDHLMGEQPTVRQTAREDKKQSTLNNSET